MTIESSKEPDQAGECAIDLAEYSENETGREEAAYYQLKHSTVRTTRPFGLAELKKTLAAFADRDRAKEQRDGTFFFVSNRPVSAALKRAITAAGKAEKITAASRRGLEAATRLKGAALRDFCSRLSILDREGDYIAQKETLHGDLTEYIAGFVDSEEVNKIIELVQSRVLPLAAGDRRSSEIVRENVLRALRVTSPKGLFPASREMEKLVNPIVRTQHEFLLREILQASTPIVIHAPGGVGKSIVAQHIAAAVPKDSHAIVYDCFGGGTYRNRSEPRHRASEALVQVANEMAAAGLCTTLLPGGDEPALFHAFVARVQQSVNSLKEISPSAVLVLLFDAADNAEMAANEVNESCFAHKLVRQTLPEGCRLVMLCRPERRHLLKLPSTVRQLALEPFSPTETAAHLRRTFPSASDADALAFHRLTGGNPRVQSTALAVTGRALDDVLLSFGPAAKTVDDQIAEQLAAAIAGVKDRLTQEYQTQIDAICRGLANLPPFIPLEILAQAAGVDVATIVSFVSDLGRPLWHTDQAVQFRDEPTETWFRKQYAADPAQIGAYATLLEPLAAKYTYAAKVLPQLLLNAGDFDRLIDLALSDRHLPVNSPIDERNIRVDRLQCAFKAALKRGQLADAARLALRAGEEVAGDKRQLELLAQNQDLIAPLQSPHRIQELAYRQPLRFNWSGSENVCSASLLSSVEEFKGEARHYLRGAERWLDIYFEEREARKEDHAFDARLQNEDLTEFAWARLNLDGPAAAAKEITRWTPPEAVFHIARLFLRRLVDAGRFAEVDAVALAGAGHSHLILAVADELATVARFPPKASIGAALDLLTAEETRIPEPRRYVMDDVITPAVVSFAEAAARAELDAKKIVSLLDHHIDTVAGPLVARDYQEDSRETYFRAVALRFALAGTFEPDVTGLLPKPDTDDKRSQIEEKNKELTQIIGALLPWHLIRARLIVGDPSADAVDLEKLRLRAKSALFSRYRTHDPIPLEVSCVRFGVLALKVNATSADLANFRQNVIDRADKKFLLKHRLKAARAAFRLEHLTALRTPLELSCRRTIEGAKDDTPEDRSRWLIGLARSVLAQNRPDAAAYFEQAVEAVSKFGDEAMDRWNAVMALAKRGAEGGHAKPEVAYRFFRCAELVGGHVEEKHWNREHVFREGVHLDPAGAFAALSRWRDRDVGRFEELIASLVQESVEQGIITSQVGWGLTGFIGINANGEFAARCIRRGKTGQDRQHFLDCAGRDFELNPNWRSDGEVLATVASEYGLQPVRSPEPGSAPEMDGPPPATQPRIAASRAGTAPRKPSWDSLFASTHLARDEGLALAVKRFNEIEGPRDLDEFWREVIRRVPAGSESDFLGVLTRTEHLHPFDFPKAFAEVHTHWREKAAVKRSWKSFLGAVGRRFAGSLVSPRSLSYWLRDCEMAEADVEALRDGVVQGLADSTGLEDAGVFFGFVELAARRISHAEAYSLLTFALSRFEQHLDDEFGDGPWVSWLEVPGDLSEAVVGLIWSALGSPFAATRWQAAHCVLRLAENSCAQEIAALVRWMERGQVGAFGSQRFPFYNLHARLYLLIAFARVAEETPDILVAHAPVFATIATGGLPHALIQKYAAMIALTIERRHPRTYPAKTVAALRGVNVSRFPRRKVKFSDRSATTPWHAKGEVDRTIKLGLEREFDRYWLNYLGDCFGVPESQVSELVCETAVKVLGVPPGENYVPDPRLAQWNNDSSRGTYHSHGSSPRIDDHTFYYSYHGMMCVAARLVRAMPVIDRDYHDDEWAEWLEGHSLTRPDARWLADRRDPPPSKRRAWTHETAEENWRWSVMADDFVDCLWHQHARPGWLFVGGDWTDVAESQKESIRIASALVSPETAESLANSLRWCRSPHDFHLPAYKSTEAEFNHAPFELTGWLDHLEKMEAGLDRFDPYAREIEYPAIEIGARFATALNLAPDAERRVWRQRRQSDPVLVSELWSEYREPEHPRDERPYRSGKRLSASVELLKQLCAKLTKTIVFSVYIQRSHDRSNYGRSKEDLGFVPSSHKIFLLSSDGILRDAKQTHRVG